MSVESCANMEERWCAEGRIEELENRKILSAFAKLQDQNLTGNASNFFENYPGTLWSHRGRVTDSCMPYILKLWDLAPA